MKTPLLLMVCLLTMSAGAQPTKRIAHWYFGYGAGLDFSNGAPVPNVNGKLYSISASAIMCDVAGNLLFYTNGAETWNRNHRLMPNGRIDGNQFAWQGVLIVPQPGNADRYYVFTNTLWLNAVSAYYSIIDMTLDNGLGDVTATKKVPLLPVNMGSQSVAGTLHCNATDYWVVARVSKPGVLEFHAWLLTANGLGAPVITSIPVKGMGHNTINQLTFSQDGKIAAFTTDSSNFFLLDFDKLKGTFNIRHHLTGMDALEVFYGNALSPAGTRLYTTSRHGGSDYSYLSQFSVTASNVKASRVNIDSIYSPYSPQRAPARFAQLRLGPDQRIYISRSDRFTYANTQPAVSLPPDSLGVISAPNNAGLTCNYQKNAVYLNNRPAVTSLPNFISNFTSPLALAPLPPINLGPDTTLCKPATLLLQAPPGLPVKWQNNSTNQTYLVTRPGKYFATAERDGCVVTDTIVIEYNDIPRVSLGPDLSICEQAPLQIKATLPGDSDWRYLWQDGATTPVYTVTMPGTYSLRITNTCGSATDEIFIKKGICGLYIPSAFTPNGNGRNDVFKPTYGNDITAFSMHIYNRWGQRVFSTTTTNIAWDGTFNGQPQPTGTYVYMVKYDTYKEKSLTRKGAFELVR